MKKVIALFTALFLAVGCNEITVSERSVIPENSLSSVPLKKGKIHIFSEKDGTDTVSDFQRNSDGTYSVYGVLGGIAAGLKEPGTGTIRFYRISYWNGIYLMEREDAKGFFEQYIIKIKDGAAYFMEDNFEGDKKKKLTKMMSDHGLSFYDKDIGRNPEAPRSVKVLSVFNRAKILEVYEKLVGSNDVTFNERPNFLDDDAIERLYPDRKR